MMREKRRSPHFVLAAIATMFAIVAMLAAGLYHFSGPTTLTVAVGPPKGDNARLMTAVAVRLSRDRAPIRLRIVEKEGPLQAAAALDKGEVDLAITRRDVAMPQLGQAVVVFRKNVVGVFATAQAKVKTISDLTGKKVGLVGRNSANEKLLESVLLQYRVDPKTVTVAPLDSDDIPGSIKAGKTDIVVASGPVIDRVLPSVFQSLSQNGRSPSIIPIKEADAIAQRNPVYESAEIIAGSFGGNPPKPAAKVETIGYLHYMMAHRSLNENTVGEVTRLMLSVRDALTPQFPRAAMIKAPDTDKDAAVPAHPGAAAYVDGELKSVFDKYGDLLYLGAMLASLFGSAGVGLAAFLKKGRAPERAVSENPLPLDRLIEIIAAARIASDQSELDLLQAEAEEILALSLKQHISGVADPVGFSGLAFALDQVRHAVSDRRAALLTQFTGPSAATNRPLRSV